MSWNSHVSTTIKQQLLCGGWHFWCPFLVDKIMDCVNVWNLNLNVYFSSETSQTHNANRMIRENIFYSRDQLLFILKSTRKFKRSILSLLPKIDCFHIRNALRKKYFFLCTFKYFILILNIVLICLTIFTIVAIKQIQIQSRHSWC